MRKRKKKNNVLSLPDGNSWRSYAITCGLVIVIIIILSFAIPPHKEKTVSLDEQLSVFMDGVMDRMSSGSCIGTLRWYTGKSFTLDFMSFEEEYGRKYEAHTDPLNASALLPPAALALADPPPYDCKDATLAVACLAAYYGNVDCDPYLNETHVGLHCMEWISKNGTRWVGIPSDI